MQWVTVEQAQWLVNEDLDELFAQQLLWEIEDYLGNLNEADYEAGYKAFYSHQSRESLVNNAQRRGYDDAEADEAAGYSAEAELRNQTLERA